MKKIFLLAAALFVLALACDNEPLEGEFVVDDGVVMGDDTTDDATGDGTDDGTGDLEQGLTAIIDGELYDPALTEVIAVFGDSGLYIDAFKESTITRIRIDIENPSVGEFTVSSAVGNVVRGLYQRGVSEPYVADEESGSESGIIKITELDLVAKRITGTFEFTAVRESDGELIVISTGHFTDIPLTDEADVPAAYRAVMFVNIGGTDLILQPPVFAGSPARASRIVETADGLFLRLLGGFYPEGPTGDRVREINLYIGLEGANFAVGTQPLLPEQDWTQETSGYQMIYFEESEGAAFSDELEGTLNIDVLDLGRRLIQGSFDFTFESRTAAGELIQIIEVTGTFDYSLDDEYFD